MKQNIVCLIAASVLLSSCSARINGSLNDDGSAELFLRASVEPRMAVLIRSLSRLNNPSGGQEQVINGPAIARSMSAAPGIKSVSLHNINPAAIEGTISILQVNAFLAVSSGQESGNFINYEQNGSNGKCTITLNRAAAPRVVSKLSPDVADYLSALMAPVITGEALSKGEYLGLVRSVYGRGVADEIAAARIQGSLDFPKPISAIRGGVVSGASKNRGEFDIPLLDLLVLETPIHYEVSWK
jgi:hypothetical protein